MNLFVAQLPDGDDPDSFVRREGGPALQAIIDAAKPWAEWAFVQEEEAGTGQDVYVRVGALRRMLVVLHAIHDPVLREHYKQRMAKLAECDIAIVNGMVEDWNLRNGVERDWRGGYGEEV